MSNVLNETTQQQVLHQDSIGLIEDLAPAILAGGVCGEYQRRDVRECRIVIGCLQWENEVR